MSESYVARKEQYLHELALRYERDGYRVVIRPERAVRPTALKDFAISLIAFGESDTIVGEVQFRDDLVGNQEFSALAVAVESLPDWRLDLMVLDREEPAVVDIGAEDLSPQAIRANLDLGRNLVAFGQPEVALMVVWSALEATLRHAAEEHDPNLDRPQSITLLRQSAWLGLIDQQDHSLLRQALRSRDRIVHGFRAPEVSPRLVEQVIAQVEHLQSFPSDPAAT